MRTTTAVPLPELAVDLTSGAARFIASAVTALGQVADYARTMLGSPLPAVLERAGVSYDADRREFYRQDATVRVSITERDGAWVLGITGARA